MKVNSIQNGIKKIAAGSRSSFAITSDGKVWAWGSNYNGQLGDGTSNNHKLTPTEVKNLDNIASIAVENFHTLAVKTNGTVWVFGNNRHGALGLGHDINENIAVPTKVNLELPIPNPPLNLKVNEKNKSVEISWNSVTGAECYIIKRSTTTGTGYVTIASDITGTTYTDTGLTNGIPYYYVIIAKNDVGESENSTEVSSTPVTPPTKPTNVAVTEKNQSVGLSWNSITGADRYIIKRSTTTGTGYVTIASDITGTTYTDTELTNGTTYYYVIIAKNNGGESEKILTGCCNTKRINNNSSITN